MGKKIILLLIGGLLLVANLFAQNIDTDSLRYQLQRKKINALLIQRKQKFEEYDQSVSKHSGIFGIQTKKDIRASNTILTDIVSSDDEILRQIKILLDYRTFQQNKVISHTQQVENTELGYAATIKQLTLQTAQLKADLEDQQSSYERTRRILIIVIVLMAASILFLLLKKHNVKA